MKTNILADFKICVSVPLNNGNAFGPLLTDLSNDFDCNGHTVFIAKILAFEVSPLSLKLIYPSLLNGFKINKTFSDRTDTEYGMPQCLVLVPLLFNINMNAKIIMLLV